MAETAPRVSTCRLGIGGCIYFRVYGKRLEQALTQHHRQHTPPFKEVGRRAAGVWLTRRRRGGNTNLSALLLRGGLRSRREPRTCHNPDSPVPAQPLPHLAEQRAAAGAGASLRVSPGRDRRRGPARSWWLDGVEGVEGGLRGWWAPARGLGPAGSAVRAGSAGWLSARGVGVGSLFLELI